MPYIQLGDADTACEHFAGVKTRASALATRYTYLEARASTELETLRAGVSEGQLPLYGPPRWMCGHQSAQLCNPEATGR